MDDLRDTIEAALDALTEAWLAYKEARRRERRARKLLKRAEGELQDRYESVDALVAVLGRIEAAKAEVDEAAQEQGAAQRQLDVVQRRVGSLLPPNVWVRRGDLGVYVMNEYQVVIRPWSEITDEEPPISEAVYREAVQE